MAAPQIYRKPVPSRIGTFPVFATAPIAATSSATVNTLIPVPKRKCFVALATVTLSTLGIAASGTILGKLQIVATDGSTARDLSGTFSLESDGVATALVPVNVTLTATDSNRILAQGETLRFAIVSTNTDGTAPVGFVSLELLVLE